MSHRLRNIVVVVIVFAAIYFVFFSSGGEFDEGLNTLNSYWGVRGVKLAEIDTKELIDLAQLSEDELVSIKNKTQSFQNETNNGALKSLSRVYISLADFLIVSQKLGVSENEITSFGLKNPCNQVSFLKERNSLEDQRINTLQTLMDRATEFENNYPSESENAQIGSFEISIEGLRAELNSSNVSLNDLERGCL